ncbi:tetratricopeptide repeat protein [Qipengyuania sediminis]|uniref:tetratricopeptide repeat protein n=1 Tax=Qipengyuania sediminis TaxID=1532023 RepID=UPI0010599D9E|nr:hypothetical protein [Qipengyuania sediminis]
MAAVLLLTSAPAALPAAAQSNAQAEGDLRLRKLEAEVRALQRRVFPDGAGRTFEPEITAAPSGTAPAGAPSTSAVTDILARLDALESQLRQLTAGQEETANGLRLLRERVGVLEGAGTQPPVTATPAPTQSPAPAAATPARATTPAGPSAQRLAAVSAIERPSTGDAGADDYAYGFRLWEAKFYPEAIQQLTLFVERNPNHAQISFGRNLLGRAYLDDGKPREAAPWFLRNYQADKNGARAGDSLLFLAEAMTVLKDTSRACIALAEFAETYPALATGRLKAQYDAARGKVRCN